MYRQRYPDDPGMHNSNDGDFRRERRSQRGDSWCAQLGAGMITSLLGFALILCSQLMLGWNESRTVQTAKSLDEGLSKVVELGDAIGISASRFDGHLVHLSGSLTCDQLVADPTFGVALHVVKLKRTVEMYQWVEHVKTETVEHGETKQTETYCYSTEWKSHVVQSSGFESHVIHRNPGSMPINSENYSTSQVRVGAFLLSQGLLDKINQYKDFVPKVLPDHMMNYQIHGKYIYASDNPNNPVVGDYRVSYAYAGLCKNGKLGQPSEVSVVAKQDGTRLASYQTEAGDTMEMLTEGTKSAKEMFMSAKSSNIMLTWVLRCVGILLSFIGFTCLTNIIRVFVAYVPVLREIITVGVVTMNISLSVSLSLFTIAISWIVFRPWLAAAILAVAVTPYIVPKLQRYSRSSTYQYTYRSQL